MSSLGSSFFVLFSLVLWFILYSYFGLVNSPRKTVVWYAQDNRARVLAMIVLIGSFGLLYLPFLSVGFLGRTVIRVSLMTSLSGMVICVAGLALAVWARLVMGAHWSGAVVLKEKHELIQDGPYRFMRHPVYAGVILALVGSAIIVGELRGFLAPVICFWGLWRRIQEEEAFLSRHFPLEYKDYRRRVKALIPYIF